MARLESEAKGGFYATPPEEMEHILKFLTVSEEATEEGITIIDPCAGEGDALKQMADHLSIAVPVTTYGIELEKSRAEQAETKLQHVLNCGYEEATMSHEAFSLMYLNPPFAQLQGKRVEAVFLDELTKDYLGEGSILILNIPQYVLKDVAKILAHRFENIQVYRFTDENNNYDRFKQVIVFGERRKKGFLSLSQQDERDEVTKKLISLAYLSKERIPTLDKRESDVQYVIQPALKKVQLFRSVKVDPSKIVASSQVCNHFEKVSGTMTSLEFTSSIRNIRPALPLKITHIATAISAGALPESMGSHLLLGVTKPIQEKYEMYDPKSDKMKEVTSFRPKSIVRVFSDKGIFNLK